MADGVDDPALKGVTVLDLSRVLAGPYCTQMMGDHGARIIKVEPLAGDGTRAWGPPYHDGISAYYSGINRNKENIAVDLSRAEARDAIFELLDAGVDVLVENFKPGTMSRWGLGWEELRERYPQLIYCQITGFGDDGPMGGLAAYDAVLQAYAGIMYMNGEPGRTPLRVPMPIVDICSGMHAFSGILLALHERQRSGLGQLVDVTLMDSALSLLHPAIANYSMSGKVPQPIGSAHPNIAPCDVFESSRGLVYVAGGTDKQFADLCRFLGAPELGTDLRFARNHDRVVNRDELTPLLARLVSEADIGEAEVRDMMALGVPVSFVRTLDQVMADPHVHHRGMVAEIGGFRVLGIPVKLSRAPGTIRTAPAKLGADTITVLRRAGLSNDTIDELLAAGVVVQRAPDVSVATATQR